MLRGQRDVVIAGVYDPHSRSEPSELRSALEAALSRFGPVVVQARPPFFAGAAGVATPAREGDDGGSVVVLDGYLTKPESWAGDEADDALERMLGERFEGQGPDFVGSLQGAFSLACWNEKEARGILARDQLGQRPMFIAPRGAQLFFGTEIRPLLDMLPTRPAPNPDAVARYLAPSALRDDLVLYAGIERVGNGDLIELRDGGWRARPYWRPVFREPHNGSSSEIADAAREEIAHAIHRHTRGATNFGIMLSGGLDSASVAALALPQLEAEGKQLRAYSAVFPHIEPVDESEQIAAIVDFLGLPSTRMEVLAGSSLRGVLETLDTWFVPELTANGFFIRHLSGEAVADGIEVMLGGEGGDEVFAAPEVAIADRLSRGEVLAALRLVTRFPNFAYHASNRLKLRLLRDFGVYPLLPYNLHHRLVRASERSNIPPYVSAGWAARLMETYDPRPWRGLDGPQWWASHADRLVRRASTIGGGELTLRSARLRRMIHRNPLIDVDLVEWTLRTAPDESFDPERTRPVLRRAIEGRIPDQVRLRPQKATFDAVRGLSLQEDRSIIRALLEDPASRIQPYTRRDVVLGLLDEVPPTWRELSKWSGYLLRLVTIECWLRLQEDDRFAAQLQEREQLVASRLTIHR